MIEGLVRVGLYKRRVDALICRPWFWGLQGVTRDSWGLVAEPEITLCVGLKDLILLTTIFRL
jgi:hypothetical protein